MRVAVVGQGHVGIVAAVGLAEVGHEVVGIECDDARRGELMAGRSPFFENGLGQSLEAGVESGRLTFARNLVEARGAFGAVVVAVGSPPLPSGGADLRSLDLVMREIAGLHEPPDVVVIKSTVPPGTSDRLLTLGSLGPLRQRYAYSPEFLAEGSALQDWRKPSRIVVGIHNPDLLPILRDLYRPPNGVPWVATTPVAAEMVKYASNAFLATKVSFINQIAGLCEDVGANIDDVVAGMAHDPRIGSAYLRPGVGYGGSCFPKDNRALGHLSGQYGRALPLIEAVVSVNNLQRMRVLKTVVDATVGVDSPTIAVAGVSFKPGTDDVREAPSTWLIPDLLSSGVDVRLWDPAVSQEVTEEMFVGASRHNTLLEAIEGSNVLLVLTDWPEIVATDWRAVSGVMNAPRFVMDGRNCLDAATIRAAGLRYRGVGRV